MCVRVLVCASVISAHLSTSIPETTPPPDHTGVGVGGLEEANRDLVGGGIGAEGTAAGTDRPRVALKVLDDRRDLEITLGNGEQEPAGRRRVAAYQVWVGWEVG